MKNGINAYESQPYRRELEVEVVTVGEDGGRHFAVFDDTILYPEGGGQPADRGWLGSSEVIDVQRVEGEIRHLLDSPAVVGPATLKLGWERRYDHMQQHTAQHLLTAVAADRFSWQTTSFHLLPAVCDVELARAGDRADEALRADNPADAMVIRICNEEIPGAIHKNTSGSVQTS